jgi:hypothetical protein
MEVSTKVIHIKIKTIIINNRWIIKKINIQVKKLKTPLKKLNNFKFQISELRNSQIRLKNEADIRLNIKFGSKMTVFDSNNGEKPKYRAQSREN